jgi:hypothetical protein
VTFFWAHFSPEKENNHAKAMAEASKSEGVKHIIWSTLDDTRKFIPLDDNRMPTLQGKYKVPHFDAKGESNHYFTDLGLPVTFLNTVFYWDNFIYFGSGPRKGPDGKLAITMPMGDKRLPGADDMGNMFQFKRDFEKEYCASRDQALSRRLNPSLLTFKEWLVQNKDLIPIE